MLKRILSVTTPILITLLLLGGTCEDGSQAPETECDGPVYNPDELTAQAIVDEPFTVSVAPQDWEGLDPPDGAGLTLTGGELPPGLALDSEWFTVTGTPTETGTWTARLRAHVECDDGVTQTAFCDITIEVLDECPAIDAPLSLFINAEVGESFVQSMNVTGGLGTLYFGYNGALPPGVEFDIDSEEFFGTPTEPGVWECEVSVQDECPVAQSADIAVTFTITAPVQTVPVGVYDCSIAGLEEILLTTFAPCGNVDPPYCMAAGDGWGALNLAAPFFSTLTNIYPYITYWGAIPLAGGPAGGDDFTTRAVFGYGQGGAELTGWNEDLQDWGMSGVWAFNTVTDACAIDGPAPDDQWFCFTINNPGSVRGIRYDEGADAFVSFGLALNSAQLEGRLPRAACPVSLTGSGVLIVTDAATPDPGKLFFGDFDVGLPATSIADLGPQPVDIRAAGGIFALTDYAMGTVSGGLVNQGSDAAITFTVDVGEGPFRLDLLELDGGNTAVACAGYDDDTYSLIVVDPQGSVVSNFTLPLPAGVTQPGGVTFLRDGSNNLIVAGNGSGNLAVVDTGL